jgi:hypothetical protein
MPVTEQMFKEKIYCLSAKVVALLCTEFQPNLLHLELTHDVVCMGQTG